MGARFVRLGIAGFKSFADPASLEILPGLTGVVGPNGCGKSNVAEALRWAMGESNVRHLRGGEMDDVIFAGAANRPSRNLAEVSLYIECEDGDLPPPFAKIPEVQVVRRIERGSGSAYRVNGREARARDVQTLFADLASGARSSALVSQGRVGALVNARPEERRAVLEEAAGITGLHARRGEAETRLRAAEMNLERAEDRRTSLETQLGTLRAQAKQAARYRTVLNAVLDAEATLLSLERATAAASLDREEAAVRGAAESLRAATRAADASARAAGSLQSSLPGLREAEAESRTCLDRARLFQEGVLAEAARDAAALTTAEHRKEQASRDLAHAQAVVRDAEAADRRLAEELERLVADAAGYPAMLDQGARQAEVAGAELQAADWHLAETAGVAAEAAVVAGALRQALDQAEARARRAEDVQTRIEAERARVGSGLVDEARLHASAEAEREAEHALSEARMAQDSADTERTRATPLAASARDKHARLEATRLRVAAQAAALADVLAVRDGERWTPVVDRLAVPSGLEAAVGAALGDELGAADTPGPGRHWRGLPALPIAAMPGQRLSEVVEGPPALGRALSCIALVSSDHDGDAGQEMLQPGQTLVSVAGGVWRWDGYTVRAGTATAATVRMQQRNRLSSLLEESARAERDAVSARAEREAAELAERTATAREQTARAARRSAEAIADRARADAHGLRARAEAASARMAALEEQAATLAPELLAALEAREAARRAVQERPDPATLRLAADQARAAVAKARSIDAAANRALEGLQRGEQARQVRLSAIGREHDDRRMRMADMAGRVADLTARVRDAVTEHAMLAAKPGRAADAQEQAALALDEATWQHAQAVETLRAREKEAEAEAGSARAAEHAAFAAREALVRAEGARDAAGERCLAVATRIAERAGALPPLPTIDPSPGAEDRLRNRLHRLTRERDDIGPVNLRADLEAGAIERDIEAIVREREELTTAIAKLRGSIGHLNREGRERLSAVFQQVDRHFQTLFARMFGGGRAHLALVGSDDPLLAGLEIFAQPPGKKLTSLGLLSGGEQALTALSLIFAVFRCNPAPLCVLDEVDAPLDDANVERLCDLLSDIVRETGTRFLVVTHHQLTMARMDRLYGVTMQERGVSRLLSVDLSRAQSMIEALAAE